MKKGMLIDLYQDNKTVRRVVALDEKNVLCIDNGEIIDNVDFHFECIVIHDDIYKI